jgi:hypothetical protein
VAENGRRPPGRLKQRGQDTNGRRFSCAVWPQQSVNGARLDLQVDSVEGVGFSEDLASPFVSIA